MQIQSCGERALHFLESKVMIEPYQSKQVTWEMCGAIMLIHDMFALPLLLAFDPEETSVSEGMAWTVRFFWTADIVRSFLTGFVDEQGRTVRRTETTTTHPDGTSSRQVEDQIMGQGRYMPGIQFGFR